MLLYCPYSTNRLTYVVSFIGKELFGEPLNVTNDQLAYLRHQGPKLNYSESEIATDDFFIQSTELLFETDIRPRTIECFEANFYKAFFQTSGDFPFDILAASFYLLTRYEEYLPHDLDIYGRYAHHNSLAYKENFLQVPLINIWIQDFKRALKNKFPELVFRLPNFKFIPSYDIDIAYAYTHKGWERNLGGLLRSLSSGLWSEAADRMRVWVSKKKDPYDSYEWLDSLHLYCRMRAYYFFLVARNPHRYDKNISPDNAAFQNLIRYHARGYTVGLHPSWQSGEDEQLFEGELDFLCRIVEKKVVHSRQHYIRLTLPDTYRRLAKAGIEKDFSMGYGSINGFRASVASSFYWYDLQKDVATTLQIFPFCFMDANSFYEQKAKPAEALQELMQFYRSIKKVNGLMVTIWHNSFLGDDPKFAGWKQAYEIFLKEEVYWDM